MGPKNNEDLMEQATLKKYLVMNKSGIHPIIPVILGRQGSRNEKQSAWDGLRRKEYMKRPCHSFTV